MSNDTCNKCGQVIQTGELIQGQSWSGDGGAHISCPEVILVAHDVEYTPVDSHTGVYEMSAENPYFVIIKRAEGR